MTKITINHSELVELERLLPESAMMLIQVLGYDAAAKLINQFGGVTLAGKNGMAKERTGGVHAMLREVLPDEALCKLVAYLGSEQFYIPRCSQLLRKLHYARFVFAVSEYQKTGGSIRRAMAQLCPTFGISDRTGWKLIKENQRSHLTREQQAERDPHQLGLF